MSIIKKTDSDSGGHWYGITTQGDTIPVYTMPCGPKAKNPTRKVSLRDAKKCAKEGLTYVLDEKEYNLTAMLPSVTTILGILHKEALMNWIKNETALAAEANPRETGEPTEAWLYRVKNASGEKSRDAMDLGTAVHDGVENLLIGEPVSDDMWPYVEPVSKWLREGSIKPTGREICISNPVEGYAGRGDLFFTWGSGMGEGYIDWKTQKNTPGKPFKQYETYGMQLAAYGVAHYGEQWLDSPAALAGNGFISTTETSRFEVVKTLNLRECYEAFLAACALWRFTKKLDPRIK